MQNILLNPIDTPIDSYGHAAFHPGYYENLNLRISWHGKESFEAGGGAGGREGGGQVRMCITLEIFA